MSEAALEFAEIMTTPRGCGKRKDQALYACCGLAGDGELGISVESLMIDPVIPWTDGPFRGVQFLPSGHDGAVDLLMWVGAENYPTVPDYVEEGRRMGFCKRIPTGSLNEDGSIAKGNNDYSKVIPHLSRLLLVHPRAYIEDSYVLQPADYADAAEPHITRIELQCDGGHHGTHHHAEESVEPCTFALWDLSAMQAHKGHQIDSCVETVTCISTPSVQYKVRTPESAAGMHFHAGSDKYTNPPVNYSPGIFAHVPLSHFEWVNQSGDGDMPSAVAELLGDNISHTAVKEQ